MEYSATLELEVNPKPHFISQIGNNNLMDI